MPFARWLLAVVVACFITPNLHAQPKTPPEGVLPVGRDGKALNLDFETGDLRDWTAEGEAFKGQPIKGDTVFARRNDSRSQHQGQFWIGGFEKLGDKPQGTLTSAPFKVTHPWGSFLVAGGPHETTCVELVRADTKQVFFRASGLEEENLRRVAVDLKDHLGKEMFVRLVDRHPGHWGHLNFDDFRFHTEQPKAPPRPQTAQADVLKHAGLPPEKAAAAMTAPEGFSVTLFVGEPDIVQPIAMCLDERGRVWVVEGNCYPTRRNAKDANDRILIFEDTDGDGKFDQRTVFMEGLNLVSGIEVGFGGVWIGAAPNFMFIPMKNDKPAGPPQILLDGWGFQDTHETLNAFTWGPDGWLYGCHGVFTHSRVGKPGTPDKQRTPLNAGVWRYHPTKHVFEVFAHGTSNPWGLDFNEQGQAFIEACVIPHCFHMIQGGRYHRQGGQHFNPHTYDDIKTIADHLHWQGANPWAGNNKSSDAGGGHAHCGLMCYLGGTWPKEYRGQLFMGNLHGRRLNVDILQAKGSGFVASHGKDFLHANDAWARFINLRYGPDGNVFLIDWYDQQACHDNRPNLWDRSNGRIYKISYRGAKSVQVDLNTKTDLELADYQLHENDWYVRNARRLLQQRGKIDADATAKLHDIATKHADPTRRLRGLWALHVVGKLDTKLVETALQDKDEYVRSWAIQLGLQDQPLAPADKLLEMAEKDSSPVVRRYLASALQRMQFEDRERLLASLLSWSEDATDPNLPLLYWYGLEPLAGNDDHRAKALELALNSKIPIILPFTVRRIAADGRQESLDLLVSALTKAKDATTQKPILDGIRKALTGRTQVAMPKTWPAAFKSLSGSTDADVRSQAIALATTFGDPQAFVVLRDALASPKAEMSLRQTALASLLAARDKELPTILHQLVEEPTLRAAALRGLALYDDPRTPAIVFGAYAKLSADEKRDALNTLASRPAYAKTLLEAVAKKQLAANEISADIVRQLRNLNDAEVEKRIGEVWGIVRTTPAERLKLIAVTKAKLLAKPKIPVDESLGRAVYAKACQQCHGLYGVGGKVGPDITGANRGSLDYLLENILDPSAVIPKEYAASVIELKSGRVVTGIVKGESAVALTVAAANETLTIPSNEIETRNETKTSMMPDDLVKNLSDHEWRSLIAYLQGKTQAPLMATADNAKDFFNGKDLTNWDGDPKLWSVQSGEIVGKSSGIKHNAFLRSHYVAGDFELSLQVKLTPNAENSGVQFRSMILADGDVKGYQADIGQGWWGKLYEEHGRGLLWKEPGDQHVKLNDWNTYKIIAVGSKIQTYLNGKLCVDLDDPAGVRSGVFALQIHSGGAMEVRFRDLKLEVKTK